VDDYLQLMMGVNPDELTAEKQRIMSERLRGMSAIGALGSTSQVTGVAQSGQNAMRQANTLGLVMGNRREDAQKEKAATGRALIRATNARTSRNERVEKLTAGERDKLEQLSGLTAELAELQRAFKDDYANPEGLGMTEALIQKGMVDEPNITKAILNNPLAKSLGLQRTGEQLEQEQGWWSLYERINKIPERAAKFGATLTSEELASWNNADVKPGQTPSQIRRNLEARLKVMKDAIARRRKYMVKLGYPEEAADAVIGELLSTDTDSLSDIITGGVSQEAIENPSEEDVPDGVDPEEWYELDPGDRLFYLQNMR
jgi:hypothetical protein